MVKKAFNFILKFGKKASEDSLSAYAAQTTFFVLLSFFPFVLMLIMIMSKLSFVQTNVMTYLFQVVPNAFEPYIEGIIDDMIYSSNSFTIITAVVSLWSAAKGFLALTYGLNKIYKVENTKNYFVTRLFSAWYTLIFMLMCVVIIVIQVFGTQIAGSIINKWPSLFNATILILSLKNAFTFLILFFMLLAVYYQLPGRKGKVRHEATGAAAAALIWMLMTKGFSVYIRYAARDSHMYGSLTSIILIIIWLYIGMNIILYGAEINYYMTEFIGTQADIRSLKFKKREDAEN